MTATQAPTEADVIRAFVRAGIAQVHVSLPATVVAYDPTTQKATVQVAIRPRVDDTITGTERPALEPTAPIPNIPVLWPSSSQGSLTFGLLPGDPVTLLVQERSTDEWRSTGLPDNAPLDARRFDLSDAVVLPGGRSFNPAAGLTAPLTVGTEVDALGAAVLGGGTVKLGSAVALHPLAKGDVLSALLASIATVCATAIDPTSTTAAVTAIGGAIDTVLGTTAGLPNPPIPATNTLISQKTSTD